MSDIKHSKFIPFTTLKTLSNAIMTSKLKTLIIAQISLLMISTPAFSQEISPPMQSQDSQADVYSNENEQPSNNTANYQNEQLSEDNLMVEDNPNPGISSVGIQASAFVVAVQDTVFFKPGDEVEIPIVLGLAQPFALSESIIIPDGSMINAKIMPVEQGAQIIAESILVEGHVIPVQAVSSVVPSEAIVLEESSTSDNEMRNFSRGGAAAGCIVNNLFGGSCDSESMDTGMAVGSLFGWITGANRREPETVDVVHFRTGSLHILSVQ
jgi:hypothetical protein